MMDERSTSAEDPELQVGSVVAERYLISHILGEGGMGVVYGARHVELGTQVAIKVIRRDLCNDDGCVQRFLHEARTASAMRHPNLVHVFDLGRLPDQRPYMVMPLLEGLDLQQWLDQRGPESPAQVAELLRGAASGLDALHARGLVHRDVKPANIYIPVEAGRNQPSVLMDFGLAALERVGSRLTKMGVVVGTPEYLPPECADGTKADVSGDVYSLAVVAYELISGELPFNAEKRVVLLADKMSLDAPELSTAAGSWVGPELDALFAEALSRTQSRRPTSCGSFVERLAAASHAPNPAKVAVAKRKATLLGQPATPPEAPALVRTDPPSGAVRHVEVIRRSSSPRQQVAAIDLATVADLASAEVAKARASKRPRTPHLATRDKIPLPESPSRRRRAWIVGIALGAVALALLLYLIAN